MTQGSSLIAAALPFVIMLGLFYIIILVPERKRRKKYNDMLEGMKINDEILTRGGIIGKIVKLEDDFAIIESGPDRIRFKIKKNGIAAVLSEKLEEK
ncbi:MULTISPECIES: preprotein translocase subunit YajC [Clostridium]|uniref:Preprotein translocase subunit YajC n=2 Tax=Clostridium TaxID=1485 RepID=A0A151AR97_9CLOT|nr:MULTISPECIES: preprotein translocase subunit YajC [Clostridium]KYH30112.1 preprotein translocase subunit YajC [Clostridium colicanis DSM 13634]MBE6044658.1 preprotein translocase subunit YajC [Clostridium thermopalmarium]PRR75420.1 preprotein translocase subunit YajC [Clostridium thermopalmarium DSM 5974]PVZ24322.1 preprotein translocase subunit YajC [Clostridium thermopalmarium DSM 5974]